MCGDLDVLGPLADADAERLKSAAIPVIVIVSARVGVDDPLQEAAFLA